MARTLVGFVILNSDEVGSAVGGWEAIPQEPRRTRMIFTRTWPEDAFFGVDPLIARPLRLSMLPRCWAYAGSSSRPYPTTSSVLPSDR
jgi:hypothetical protein